MLFFDNEGMGWLLDSDIIPTRVLDPMITYASFAAVGLVEEANGQRTCTVPPAEALVRARGDSSLSVEARKLLLHLAAYFAIGPLRPYQPHVR
jgi:hypothetical protein